MAAPYVPANETTFSLQGFTNGPLFPQVDPSSAIYQTPTKPVNLTILPNDVASLTFSVNENSSLALELAAVVFDADRFLVSVLCASPLNGQYGTLSRALFYTLLVISLVFRRHAWISVAALGTAMTYAATSAVHLLALVTNFEFKSHSRHHWTWNRESSEQFGDIDFIGIFPILTASGIILTPILMWSTSVKRHEAQAVVISWGILIFVGLAIALYKILNKFFINMIPSFASCNRSPECMESLIHVAPNARKANRSFNILTYSAYQACDCIDFCGTLGPNIPLRKSATLTPFLSSDEWSFKMAKTNKFLLVSYINIFAMCFIVVSGVFGILASHFSQEEIRNWIFRFCNGGVHDSISTFFKGERERKISRAFTRKKRDSKHKIWRKCRRVFAKGMATVFFILVILTTVLSPAVFVMTIFMNEIVLLCIPINEQDDAIGAWGSWVGATFVLIAAMVQQFGKAWKLSFTMALDPAIRVLQYSKSDRPHYPKEKYASLRDRVKLFFLELTSPWIHGWYSTIRALWTSRTTVRLFMLWWKDPEEVSKQGRAAIEKAWQVETEKAPGGKPSCPCRMCTRDK